MHKGVASRWVTHAMLFAYVLAGPDLHDTSHSPGVWDAAEGLCESQQRVQ